MIRRVRWEGMPGVLAFELGPDDLFPFTVSLGVGPGRWLVGVDVCYYDGPHVSVGLGPIGTVAFTPKSGVGNRVAMWLYENGWGVWRCRPPPPTMAPRLTPSLVAVSSKVPGRCPAGSRSPSTGGSGCRPALRRTPMSNKGNLILIMRSKPFDLLEVYTGGLSLEPVGELLEFVARRSDLDHGALVLTGPSDATDEERVMARKEAAKRWPGMRVLTSDPRTDEDDDEQGTR